MALKLSWTGFAVPSSNPWTVITDRNAFGLRPIPPPPPAAPAETAPPPPANEVKLTGITTLLGKPRVFIEIVNAQTKKVERPSAMLVGEKEFDVEVLSIEPRNGIVHIRNAGVEATLDFEHNGIKHAASPATPLPAPIAAHSYPAAVMPAAFNPVASAAHGSRAIVTGGDAATTPAMAPNGTPMLTPEQAQARIAAQRHLLEMRQNGGGNLPLPPVLPR